MEFAISPTEQKWNIVLSCTLLVSHSANASDMTDTKAGEKTETKHIYYQLKAHASSGRLLFVNTLFRCKLHN